MGAHDRSSFNRVQSAERAREDHSALHASPALDTGPASLFCGRFATDDPPRGIQAFPRSVFLVALTYLVTYTI